MVSIQQFKKSRFAFLPGIVALLALLLTTLQVPVNTHWCGGKVFNRSLYTLAAPCAMDTPKANERAASLVAPPCCRNESTLLAASGLEFNGPASTVQNQPAPVVLATVASVAPPALLAQGRSSLHGFPQGPPPWSAPDLYDLYQAYLI